MPFEADAALIESINAATVEWRQGDVVEFRALGWLAVTDAPLTEHSAVAETAQDSNVASVFTEVDSLVVISQTCDVVRDCSSRPHVELARLIRLEEPVSSEARRGSRPRYVPVPGAGADAFADLDLVMTAEKSFLARCGRIAGLPTDADQRRFGRSVGRVYSRFAFPDDLSDALRGLTARVRDKHARDSKEGQAIEGLEEIRVTGTPSWSATEVDVFLTFAPPTRAEAESIMDPDQWDEMVDSWLNRADPVGIVRSIDGAMIPLDEFTAREYVDSDPLDLDYLSSTPAAQGS